MTKKWLWYVCIGLICCSSIAYVYAKQSANVIRKNDSQTALKQKAAVTDELVQMLRDGATNIENAERSSAPVPTQIVSAPTEMEAAKSAYVRMLYGEMLPGDKTLIQANFPEPEFVRPEENPLDDNGGTWFTWNGSLGITDNTCFATAVHADIPVAGLTGNILDVEVKIVSLTHTWDSDMRIWLVGPTGVVCSLSTNNGGSGDNYINTVFDDEAATLITAGAAPFTGSFRPEGLLSSYDGLDPNATWQLWICDGAGGDVGTLTSWQIQIQVPVTGVDLSVSNLTPCGNTQPNPTQSVSMRVSNTGTVASAATTARFNFDNGTTIGTFAVPPIAPTSFFDVFFTTTFDLTVGPHSLRGYVDADAGDANQVNDTTSCTVNGFNCYDYVADLGLGNYSHTSTTVGAGDDCVLRAGADRVYQVIIPTAGNYTFSTCNGAAPWDAYMYITTACCGGTTVGFDDDACPTSAMPLVTCLSLAAGTYYVDIEPWSSASTGPYTLDITQCAFCDVICEPGDISENAPTEVPDSTFMVVQDPNGGCNNTGGPLFGAIQCGETVCGNSFNYLSPTGLQYRDTDWYLFTVTSDDTVRLTVSAEFGALFGIVRNVVPCASPAFVVSGTTTTPCVAVTVQSCLAPGTYAAFVSTSAFSGTAYVAGNVNYDLTMTCVPCTPPVGRCCYLDEFDAPACAINTSAACVTLGGSWTSGITDCALSPCPTARCCYNAGANCQNTTIEHCNSLLGTWTSGFTCEANPCPVPQVNDDCAGAILIDVPPFCSASVAVNTEGANTTIGDTCDFDSNGPDLFYKLVLADCRRIAMKAEGGDTHLSIYPEGVCAVIPALCCNDDQGNFGFNGCALPAWDVAEQHPVGLESYMALEIGPGTYYIRAGMYSTGFGAYTLTVFDNGPCVAANPCESGDVLTNVTVIRGGSPVNAYVTLNWTNTNAGDYNVWSSTNPLNDGDPDGPDADLKAGDDPDWTLETLTPLSLPVGPVAWDRPAGFEPYVNFVVTPDCDPSPFTGRCCYEAGTMCANNTLAECTLLGGDWTLGTTCECAPCPPPPPLGRCCYLDGNNQGACANLSLADCQAIPGWWTWAEGLTCEATPCDIGRCCYNAGANCADIQEVECVFLAGTWTFGLDCATACPVQGPNDECVNAIPIALATPTTGTNVGATGTDITSCTFSDNLDVWYSVNLAAGTLVTATLCDAGTNFDTGISVFDACGGTELACNDDATCTFSGLFSTTTFTPATAGTYYVRVVGYNGQSGDFVLTVTQ